MRQTLRSKILSAECEHLVITIYLALLGLFSSDSHVIRDRCRPEVGRKLRRTCMASKKPRFQSTYKSYLEESRLIRFLPNEPYQRLG
jgi:hypothetical protein